MPKDGCSMHDDDNDNDDDDDDDDDVDDDVDDSHAFTIREDVYEYTRSDFCWLREYIFCNPTRTR